MGCLDSKYLIIGGPHFSREVKPKFMAVQHEVRSHRQIIPFRLNIRGTNFFQSINEYEISWLQASFSTDVKE